MFWATFSGSTRRTSLIPLFGNLESRRGGINRWVIRDLYLRILPTLLANSDGIFQQDNASTHTAYVVREALAEMGIEVMDMRQLAGWYWTRSLFVSIAALWLMSEK